MDNFFPKNFLCSSLCSDSLKVILAVILIAFFEVFYAKSVLLLFKPGQKRSLMSVSVSVSKKDLVVGFVACF